MKFVLFYSILILPLLCSCLKKETTKVAVIDTEFCTSLIKSGHDLKKTFYATSSSQMGIAPECLTPTFSRRIHGHFVLKNLLKKIPKTFEIHPIVVFEKNGIQTKKSWKKAFNYIKTNKIAHIISAAAYFNQSNDFSGLPKKVNATLHLSAGQYGNKISKGMKLWPHEIRANKIFYGHNLFHKDKSYPSGNLIYKPNVWIDEDKKSPLKGSSYALSFGLSL